LWDIKDPAEFGGVLRTDHILGIAKTQDGIKIPLDMGKVLDDHPSWSPAPVPRKPRRFGGGVERNRCGSVPWNLPLRCNILSTRPISQLPVTMVLVDSKVVITDASA
jgi:hypothetical protein